MVPCMKFHITSYWLPTYCIHYVSYGSAEWEHTVEDLQLLWGHSWLCTCANSTYTGNVHAKAVNPYNLFCQLALSIFLWQLKPVSIMYTCCWTIQLVRYASTKSWSMLIICWEYTCTVHSACMGILIPCTVSTRWYYAWNTPVPRMENASTMHGVR